MKFVTSAVATIFLIHYVYRVSDAYSLNDCNMMQPVWKNAFRPIRPVCRASLDNPSLLQEGELALTIPSGAVQPFVV